MATVKSYTDLSQSKKLADILPLESADMIFVHTTDLEGDEHYDIDFRNNQPLFEDDICAWGLAALLEILPKQMKIALLISDEQDKYGIGSVDTDEFDCVADNPVDACYRMILKLYEQKLLYYDTRRNNS